ncbi:MAG TPA: type II secretion system inner membrane protein GspF [Nitrospiraceae bacterium]|nr:type II secretion system inner membrane protein GspF [Nitrospiraceae bacterium]
MPVYQYKGLRGDGQGAVGIIDADSLKGARQKLRQGGIYPIDVNEQRDAGETRGLRESARGSAVLAGQDLAILTRQLATLLAAGLPLVEALAVLVEQSEKKPVQSLLAEVREQIREGKALSRALESFPHDFTTVYLHMIRAGEASGALEPILVRLADFLDNQLKLKQKVTNAVMYPALMLVVGVAILFFLMVFVVPKITAVFADLHQALPWPTLVLIGISDGLGSYWPVMLAAGALGIWAFRRAIATPAGRARADHVLLRLPLIGTVARMVSISRLTGTLATMLSSGVQLLEALDVAKRVMNNTVLEQAVTEARENIREGESIALPLKRSGMFPPLVTHMIGVGEKSGELEEMLRRISQIYDSEVDRVISRLTSLMEPVMILFMGGIVFFIVLAILLPIFQMSQIVK